MSLVRFVAKRVLEIVVALFIIATLIFVLFKMVPGDPASRVINPTFTPELREILRARFGLDKPLWQQYLIYVKNLLHGEFGTSFYWEGDVFDILKVRFLPTILLFTLGTLMAYALGINLGRIIAWRRGSKLEYGFTVGGLFFFTMPIFWLGLLAIWVFSYRLDLFPVGGMKTPEIWGAAVEAGLLTKILDVLYHLFLPLTVFTIWIFTGNMLLMKNSMLETLKEDYITTARAKGLAEKRIRDRHAARNAMLPVVTALSLAMAFSFNGGVLTETVFSWPGLGRTLVQATINLDYPLAQGAFILLAGVVLLAVLTADILYAYLDPRIKY
ncbi:MAG: peptide ABC transporter permease [Theionarchaea archaeon DG-70-1]|nr:MAG: peptide ABC transporter permease [Theionarchaea archaeon DG-70-1]